MLEGFSKRVVPGVGGKVSEVVLSRSALVALGRGVTVFPGHLTLVATMTWARRVQVSSQAAVAVIP